MEVLLVYYRRSTYLAFLSLENIILIVQADSYKLKLISESENAFFAMHFGVGLRTHMNLKISTDADNPKTDFHQY